MTTCIAVGMLIQCIRSSNTDLRGLVYSRESLLACLLALDDTCMWSTLERIIVHVGYLYIDDRDEQERTMGKREM